MIIIDNFLKDGEMKRRLQSDSFWKIQSANGLPLKWFGWGQRVSNPIEEFLFWFWSEKFSDYYRDFSEGWEYWTHHLGVDRRKSIDFHLDTDINERVDAEKEQKMVRNGEIMAADHGLIYYCHTDPCSGGYLEIKRANNEVERIEPVPDRLILFQPNVQHRVTEVTSGHRRSIVSNLWSFTPDQYWKK